jgi:hypothetical protein
MAQRGNLHVGLFRRLQNRRAFLGADLLAVNGQCVLAAIKFFRGFAASTGCWFAASLPRGHSVRLEQLFVFVAEKPCVLIVGFGAVCRHW